MDTSRSGDRYPMTRRQTPEQEDPGQELISLLQEGCDCTVRLSQHTGLLERRVRMGANPADLLMLVRDIRFAIDDLLALFRSVAAAVPSPASRARRAATESGAPRHAEVVDLGALVSRCLTAVRRRTGVALVCDVASDLPAVTADAQRLEQVFSLLLEHLIGTGARGDLEVRVHWGEGRLVLDVYDAGRGVSREAYVALRQLVESLHATLVVTRELGVRSRVEFGFPAVATRAHGADMSDRGTS